MCIALICLYKMANTKLQDTIHITLATQTTRLYDMQGCILLHEWNYYQVLSVYLVKPTYQMPLLQFKINYYSTKHSNYIAHQQANDVLSQ